MLCFLSPNWPIFFWRKKFQKYFNLQARDLEKFDSLHLLPTKGPPNQAFVLNSPAFTGTQTPSFQSIDQPSREGGRWEMKHFIGMA